MSDTAQAFAGYGTDWLYPLAPLALLLVVGALLARRDPARHARPLDRMSHGAAAVTGLPAWCAGPLVIGTGALIIAVEGFLWDVAWHIDVGRDEFLFSPPHICLLVGIGLLAVAGFVSMGVATRDRADTGWRLGPWRIPYGSAALMLGGLAALGGFGVDDLWHRFYGLDVTMWSPPHLVMISAAAFSPLAMWLLLAEAGPSAGRRIVRVTMLGVLAGAVVVALSTWQLEFDLGVPQWQDLFHPVLVAIAAGFGLVAGRAALGPLGALKAAAAFIAIRGVLAVLTVGVWHMSLPAFVPYIAAAVAVEAAFVMARRRGPLLTTVIAGVGVGTVGLAGAWVATHLWGWHAWQPSLLPRMWIATAAAVAAAVLGGAFGRVVSHRPSHVRPAVVLASFAVVIATLIAPLGRTVPAATVTLEATRTSPGRADIIATFDPPEAAENADRLHVMAWQGGGHEQIAMREIAPGRWAAQQPVPVDGDWKTSLRLGKGSHVTAVAVSMPADPEIAAPAVPLQARRTTALVADRDVMLREAKDGPAWPGLIGYTYVGLAIATILASLFAATVALDRRRRGLGWSRSDGRTLVGRRILVTGAEGGIGRATTAALQAQGATVVGLDLHGDSPTTLVADVRDPGAVRAAVAEAVARLGGLDCVVANAGIGVADDALANPDEAARGVMDVNLFGSWNVVAAAAPHLLTASGHVVVVGSGLAVANAPYAAAYTASKRAVTGWADVLRLEHRGRLRVSVIQPAYIRTGIHDIPNAAGATLDGVARVETVADAAGAIVAALETGRREMGSSPITTAQLWLARRLPATADRVVHRRWMRAEQTRPRPSFMTPPAPDPAAAHVLSDRSDLSDLSDLSVVTDAEGARTP